MLAQDIMRGAPVIILENKASLDLFGAALDYIPRERIEDVVILDVADTTRPPGFNILQGNPYVVASDLQDLFASLYSDRGKGVRLPEALYHGLLTLKASSAATKPMTFVDLVPLFVPMGRDETYFSTELTRGVPDPHIRNFWQQIENRKREQRDVFFAPVMERIWQLNARAPIRNIIGQSQISFDIAQIIREKKIFLANFSGLGDDTAELLITLIFNAIWNAARSGACDPNSPTFLYADEAYKYMKLPISIADMFAQARSYGLSLNMATQDINRLPNDVRSAILSNARSKILFRPGPEDAQIFSRVFGNKVSEQDLLNLGQHEIIGQFATDQGISEPFTAVTMPPIPKLGNAEKRDDELRQKIRYAIGFRDEEYVEALKIIELRLPAGRFNAITDDIMQVVIADRQKAVSETARAYGGCTNCYGKGYATAIGYMSGVDTGTDIGSPGGYLKHQNNVMRYCDCDRGKQLMGLTGKDDRRR